MNILTPGLKPCFRLRLLFQRDWHLKTCIQIQQRNCPRFSRGSSFRRALSEGRCANHFARATLSYAKFAKNRRDF